MSAINKFANETDYNAHIKSTTNSEVSLVVTPRDLHHDGLNVENKHKIPAIGDCLYLDSNGKRHFFYGATVNNAKLVEAGYTPVGIVAEKYDNNKVLLIYKELKREQFCNVMIRLLSDYKIDGTPNNIQVRWYNSSSVKTVISNTFTESCSDLQDFVTKFDSFLRANQVSSYQWHCELMKDYEGNDAAFMIVDNWVGTYQVQDLIESGATSSMYNFSFVGLDINGGNFERVSGGIGRPVGCNKERLLEYYSIHKSYTTNLEDLPDCGYGIVNKTDFDNNVYPNIKAYYGDWESYIDSIMIKRKPCIKGDLIREDRAKELTEKMINITYKDINGVTQKLFIAANLCDSLEPLGKWYMAGIVEANDVLSKIKKDKSDPINVAMHNINPEEKEEHNWIISKIEFETQDGDARYYYTLTRSAASRVYAVGDNAHFGNTQGYTLSGLYIIPCKILTI